MKYNGKYEVEAYQLTKQNIEEMAAWTNWSIVGDIYKQSEQYLSRDEKRCNIGEYIVKQNFTGNEEFYVLSEHQFIQKLNKI